ncbi:WD40 repeat-like protein [Suillus brevipes Sb2]|nr:WD40 repeat-like protein [Suillus brevipes Sb2]
MKDDKQLPGSPQKPVKTFEGHKENIIRIATFPDGKRIATASADKTIRIWRLEDGAEMMKWVAKQCVWALVLLENGRQIVSAEGELPDGIDEDDFHFDPNEVLDTQLWVRDVESGRVVAGPLAGHTSILITLDMSPDREILASGSFDRTVILWDTITWQRKSRPIWCSSLIICIRFSPTGQLGVATEDDVQIWDLNRRERLAQFKGHRDFNQATNFELTWARDGAHLFSAGNRYDPVIRSWDTSTWKQAGDPWIGHGKDYHINHIILNPAGTLLASASQDCTVRLWRFHTGTEVARFNHSDEVLCIAFSVDERSIFSCGHNKKISQWNIPEDVLAAAESDSLASAKNEAARGNHNMKRLLNLEIPGQRQNKLLIYQRTTYSPSPFVHAESPPKSRSLDLRTFFDGIRPSSDKKGNHKERRSRRNAPQVVDVPLGQVTYADAVGVDDGVRPYVLFFCLSWFQKKKKKPDPPRPVYDDEFDDDESEHAVADIPIPTIRTQPDTRKEMKLSPKTFFQPQPEAGPSRLAPSVDIGQEATRNRIVEHNELELKPIASQTQPETGPSRLTGLEADVGEESS